MKPNLKKLTLIGVFSIGIVIPVFAFSCFGSNTKLFQARADEQFLMTLSESTNKLDEETTSTYLRTNLGNEKQFSYEGYSLLSESWGSITSGGYLINDDSLPGLTSIDIIFNDLTPSFTLMYSPSNDMSDGYVHEVSSISSLNYSYNFDEYNPNHFKFIANSTCNIKSIELKYSCSDYHLPYQVTYHLNGGSLLEAPMSEKYSYICNRVNTGTSDYNTHYTTDSFIFYNDNKIETLYAHKIGLVRHNIDNEYIVHEIVPSGTSIYQKGNESTYFIIAHSGLNTNNPTLWNYLYNRVSTGDILRVDKPLGTTSLTNANVKVTFYNNDSFVTKTYYNHPYTLKSPSKDGVTFAGYYLNSDFEGDAVTQVTSNISLYVKYNEEVSLRQRIVNSMHAMSQIEWTPSSDITYYTNESSKKFVAGTKYIGLPYTMGNGRTTTMNDPLGIFKSALDDDNYTYIGPTGYNSYYGSDCSSSVSGAWKVNGIETNATYTGNMIPGENSKILALGGYTYSDRTNMTKTICANNGSTKIYSCYDLLKPGDAIIRRVSSSDGWAGHVRLVTSVDTSSQTVTVIEQSGWSGGNTTWKVYASYSYSTLFNNSYIPIRPSGLD